MALQKHHFAAIAAAALLASCATGRPTANINTAESQWVSLFDGTSFDGWHEHGGMHEFAIKDGMIVGTAVAKQPNAFLVTDRTYTDFIFEADFLSDGSMNSGVIFRADYDPEYRGGRLFGYQADIDPTDRKWTGGLYEEALRGWLVPIEDNEACRSSFQQHKWNRMRIEALGSDLRIFVNDVPCARSVQDNLTEGVIGLQVHSVRPGWRFGEPGDWIAWRNIRILTKDVARHRLP
jgi:hypothetical protein